MGANLLPGRSIYDRMLPLTMAEYPALPHPGSPLPFDWNKGAQHEHPVPASDLLSRLTFGELAGVVAAPKADRAELLRSFAFVHLEEEIRREALVKDWGVFLRFMHLAAAKSGQIVNFASILQEDMCHERAGRTVHRYTICPSPPQELIA
jgi:predicted AAA+ superfamily ATPase